MQKPKVIDRNNGKYDVKYKATCPGICDVQVLLKDKESAEEEFKDIKGSVYHPEITNGIDPKKTMIDCPGVERQNDQEDNVFTIHLKSAKGEDITEGGAPFQVNITLTDKSKAKKNKDKPEPTEV